MENETTEIVEENPENQTPFETVTIPETETENSPVPTDETVTDPELLTHMQLYDLIDLNTLLLNRLEILLYIIIFQSILLVYFITRKVKPS